MKNHVRIISALVLCVMIFSAFTGCNLLKPSWQRRWDAMVVDKSKEIKSVTLGKTGIASSAAYLVKELEEDDVNEFLEFFLNKKITFEKTDEEIMIGITTGAYFVTLINDNEINYDEEGKILSDDTGSPFKYAVEICVDDEGYLLVPVRGEITEYYKSDITVDVDVLDSYYDKCDKYFTTE